MVDLGEPDSDSGKPAVNETDDKCTAERRTMKNSVVIHDLSRPQKNCTCYDPFVSGQSQ